MKKILLVGSSIFELWANAATVAPGAAVINRAVGGTITSYWKAKLADVLASVSPDVVLFYCGSNDINNCVSGEEIVANTVRCRELVRAFSVDVHFAYFIRPLLFLGVGRTKTLVTGSDGLDPVPARRRLPGRRLPGL